MPEDGARREVEAVTVFGVLSLYGIRLRGSSLSVQVLNQYPELAVRVFIHVPRLETGVVVHEERQRLSELPPQPGGSGSSPSSGWAMSL